MESAEPFIKRYKNANRRRRTLLFILYAFSIFIGSCQIYKTFRIGENPIIVCIAFIIILFFLHNYNTLLISQNTSSIYRNFFKELNINKTETIYLTLIRKSKGWESIFLLYLYMDFLLKTCKFEELKSVYIHHHKKLWKIFPLQQVLLDNLASISGESVSLNQDKKTANHYSIFQTPQMKELQRLSKLGQEISELYKKGLYGMMLKKTGVPDFHAELSPGNRFLFDEICTMEWEDVTYVVMKVTEESEWYYDGKPIKEMFQDITLRDGSTHKLLLFTVNGEFEEEKLHQ